MFTNIRNIQTKTINYFHHQVTNKDSFKNRYLFLFLNYKGYLLFTTSMMSRVANPKMLAHETMFWELGALSNPSPASQKWIGLSFSAVFILH